jgi:hypothetical protein
VFVRERNGDTDALPQQKRESRLSLFLYPGRGPDDVLLNLLT